MSGSVLYDAPGPRARTRNRIYTVVVLVAIAALLVGVVVRLADTGQLDGVMWKPFAYQTIQSRILEGLLATLKAFALAAVFSLLLGGLLALGRASDHRVVRWSCGTFVEFFRAMPLVVMIFVLYSGVFTETPLWALVIGLTLYNGSVQAEVFRAGILAVPRGQSEAAFALGLRKTQVMTGILIPQAVRTMLPTIISQLVVTLKDTSLGFIITYEEMLYVGKLIANHNQTSNGFIYIQVSIVIGALYIGMCLLLSALARWVEKRGRRSRTGLGVGPAVALETGLDNPVGEAPEVGPEGGARTRADRPDGDNQR